MAVPITSGIDHPSLLGLLADGQLRSGVWLARELGVSRAAVWKGIERLRMRGIDIEAVPRCGYCLPTAVELLDDRTIRAAVDASRAGRLRSLELLFDVDVRMSS
jgi:BirA family transcriptional regulator, biotin operon repressor / biotin---[acetyl-CoA-carboxylase] ligase